MSQKKKHKNAEALAGQPAFAEVPATCDIAIVGGGAAGLACAVACFQEARAAGAAAPSVVVLEQGRRVGASIMRSGNGRCNFSNAHIDTTCYSEPDFVGRVYSACEADFSFASVTEWFEDLGLVWIEAPGTGGLLYPYSNKANSVLDVLRLALDEAGVQICVGTTVETVAAENDGFALSLEVRDVAPKKGAKSKGANAKIAAPADPKRCVLRARRVVLAAGGAFNEDLLRGFAEVPVVERTPVLGPLRAQSPSGVSFAALDGIRAQARVNIPARDFSEEGEVLFREYGISGIVVFNASRFVQPGDAVLLDLAPAYSEEALQALLQRRAKVLAERPAREFLDGFLVSRLGEAVLYVAGVASDSSIDATKCAKLAQVTKAFPLIVDGIADEKASQVHRGGIAPDAVSAETFELAAVSGAYATGEALNVDGPCGGYNLHWAWVSGRLAARAAVRSLRGEGS